MNPKSCPTCQSPIPADAPGGLCPACVLRDAGEESAPTPGTPPLEEIAAAFPQWEILGLIGRGGMGFVYRVRQPALDRIVALKILDPALGRDPAFAERFAREARTLGKLQHPNIVAIFEHGEAGGFFYLVMEHVDGVNLRQAMQAGRFTPEQALAIIPGICDALQAAHAQGVWHRDIKPENILLDKDGRVKIADFGIARLVGDPQRDFTLTMTGHALGSAAYMAPEQLEKPHHVDHRADIYSLGVVLYEMLTGELPLGRFPLPSQRAEVGKRIDEIVLRTLEKERELRQQSATEVKTEVEGAGNGADPESVVIVERLRSPALKFMHWSWVSLFLGALLWTIAYGLSEPMRLATDSKDWFPKIYPEDPEMFRVLGTVAALLKLSIIFGGAGLLGCLWGLLRMRLFRQNAHSEKEAAQPGAAARESSGRISRWALAVGVVGALGVPVLNAFMGGSEVMVFATAAWLVALALGLLGWRDRIGKFVVIVTAGIGVIGAGLAILKLRPWGEAEAVNGNTKQEVPATVLDRREPTPKGTPPPQPPPDLSPKVQSPAEPAIRIDDVLATMQDSAPYEESVIEALADGSLRLDGVLMDLENLRQNLIALAGKTQNRPVRIRGYESAPYQRIVEVMEVCQQAGIWNLSFDHAGREPVEKDGNLKDSPEIAMKEFLLAAKVGNKAAMKARSSRSLIALVDDDGELLRPFRKLDRMEFVEAKQADDKTAEVVLETTEGLKHSFTFQMVFEDGRWKLTEYGR